MAKIDLNAMSIEELVTLRDNAIDKLAEKVAARQAELAAEIEKLSQYGKPGKKAAAAAQVAKPKRSNDKRSDDKKIEDKMIELTSGDEGSRPVAEAA